MKFVGNCCSDLGRTSRRALRLLEKALCRLCPGHGVGPSRLFRPASLTLLARTLSPPRFLLRSRRSLNPVSGREADFEFDDLVPDRVGALVIGNCEQFA